MHRSTTARTGVLLVAPSGSTATAVEPDGRHDVARDGVLAAQATYETVRMHGVAPPGATVEVRALGTEQEPADWAEGEPVATATAGADGTFEAELARFAADGSDRLDEDVRSQWRYAFSLRSLAGETLTATAFEGRTRH